METGSLTLKEWLTKKTSQITQISERTVDIVIHNQFNTANDAVNTNYSVELSGFGKFIFNNKRAIRQMAKYLKEKDKLLAELAKSGVTERRKKIIENRMFVLELNIKVLKPRIKDNEQTKSDI